MKTITIKGGVEYAQVKDRLKEFHKMYPKGCVHTKYLGDGVFRARVFIDDGDFYTGHSKVGTGIKAFEKAETVAVGRALAFLGIMADGAIATAEEMEEIDITNTDEYKDAIYRLESELELAERIDHQDLDWIRENYHSISDMENLWKCVDKVKEIREEKRKMDGHLKAKEINEKVQEKLDDERA